MRFIEIRPSRRPQSEVSDFVRMMHMYGKQNRFLLTGYHSDLSGTYIVLAVYYFCNYMYSV